MSFALKPIFRFNHNWGMEKGEESLKLELARRRATFAEKIVKLHEAVEKEKWREVVGLAEEVLALAPQHPEARKARALAWKAIEPIPA